MIARLTPIAGALGALLVGLAVATPAAAQANDKVLMVFGKDPCPAGTVCVRAPESERYRIPKSIRDTPPPTVRNSQRELAASTAAVSASGTGSCSATGAGGWTGCWKADMDAARAERKANAESAPQAPQN